MSCGNDITSCGTCSGGDDAMVYQYAHTRGIPHESCSSYMAEDTACSDTEIGYDTTLQMEARPHCYNCDEQERCWNIPEYKRLYSGAPYALAGEATMMRDIHANGPISCAIMVTNKMKHGYGDTCLQAPKAGRPLAMKGTSCITGKHHARHHQHYSQHTTPEQHHQHHQHHQLHQHHHRCRPRRPRRRRRHHDHARFLESSRASPVWHWLALDAFVEAHTNDSHMDPQQALSMRTSRRQTAGSTTSSRLWAGGRTSTRMTTGRSATVRHFLLAPQ